jgi:hypothetical protein
MSIGLCYNSNMRSYSFSQKAATVGYVSIPSGTISSPSNLTIAFTKNGVTIPNTSSMSVVGNDIRLTLGYYLAQAVNDGMTYVISDTGVPIITGTIKILAAPAPSGVYLFSMGNIAGVVETNIYVALTNPAGSNRTIAFAGAYISSGTTGAAVSAIPLRGRRVTGVSGGTLVSASEITKLSFAYPSPFAEVRIDNPTATIGSAIFSSPAPRAQGATSFGTVHDVELPPGSPQFLLLPGEGAALRTTAGEVTQSWNITLVWAEI